MQITKSKRCCNYSRCNCCRFFSESIVNNYIYLSMNKILAITLFLSILATGCKSGQKESPKDDLKACSITDARQFYKDNTDKIEELCQEWEPNADLELALYTFIDIDNDGLEEMYIKESNEGYGWLLCCGSDSVEMITSEDRNFRISCIGNIVNMRGMFPSGSAFSKYFELKGSRVIGPDFMEEGEYDFQKDTLVMSYVPVDGDKPVQKEDIAKFFGKLEKLMKNDLWYDLNSISEEQFDMLGRLSGRILEEDYDNGYWTEDLDQ